jgi:hypothetical protein
MREDHPSDKPSHLQELVWGRLTREQARDKGRCISRSEKVGIGMMWGRER